jgi:hypothetical protein
MAKLNELAAKPTMKEHDLFMVWESVRRLIKTCFEGILDCENRGWTLIPFWLASSNSTIAATIPFRTHFPAATIDRYASYWQQLFMFCLRGMDDMKKYGIEFTISQQQKLMKLRAILDSDTIKPNILDELIFEISLLFIQYSDYIQQKSVLIYFTGVLGYHISWKQWRKPEDYTNILAGFQFCLRVIILESAIPQKERINWFEYSTLDPLKALRNVRDYWLTEDEPSPFNYIHKLLNYGIAAAKNSTTRSRVRWSADNKILYFDGRALNLTEWKRYFIIDNF